MAARYVIIGSGIAGLSAAETIRQLDPAGQITMISEEPHAFYSRPGLAYLLRGDIPERQLVIRTAEEFERLKITRLSERVAKLDIWERWLELADGRRLAYDRLLIATGAQACPPPFPGGELEGIVKLDSLDDARGILAACGRFRTGVVVGGGITAMELAEGLVARGMRTHYLLRGKRYLSDVLDETESQIVLDRLRHEGVKIHLETQIKQALGENGRLVAVETQAGERIDCSLLAVAIGVRPRAELAQQAGLVVDRGIVVNEYLQASAAEVFAAGDVAQVRDPRTGVAALDVLWPIALAQGACAGANMVAMNRPYRKATPYNVTQLAGLRVTIIGSVGGGKNEDLVAITRGESEEWRMGAKASVISRTRATDRVRLLLGERQIVGGLVMGDQAWSRPLEEMISEGADISRVRPALLGGGETALAELEKFYRAWRLGSAEVA